LIEIKPRTPSDAEGLTWVNAVRSGGGTLCAGPATGDVREREMTSTNEALRRSVLDELEWEPAVDATHIGVAAAAGVVTLSGRVASYAEKLAAERAVRRVKGVHAIAEELTVHPPQEHQTTDDAIAERAVKIIAWSFPSLADRVGFAVEQGWVTISGTVDWQYQRLEMQRNVQKLGGVRGVTNLVTITPRLDADDVRAKIEAAFKRNAEIDSSGIRIDTKDGIVTLSGSVRNWHEKDMAEIAAWSAPGVVDVDDHLLSVR
jgi:osmotically-inducible protein OsmY